MNKAATKAAIQGLTIAVVLSLIVLGVGLWRHDFVDPLFLGMGLILCIEGLWANRFVTPALRLLRFNLLPGVLWLLLAISGFNSTSLMSLGSTSWWIVFGLALLTTVAMTFVQWWAVKQFGKNTKGS